MKALGPALLCCFAAACSGVATSAVDGGVDSGKDAAGAGGGIGTGGAGSGGKAGTGGGTGSGGKVGTGGAGSGGSASGGASGSGGKTGSGGSGSGGSGSGGDAGAAGGGGAPTFALEFTTSDAGKIYSRAPNGGSVKLGVANAAAPDNNVAELLFKGNASLGPSDKLTPDYATEIGTNASFGFGTFRARVQLARCASSEELVNGIFTYFNDGADHDGDGLIDNSEIDIEILCSDPSIISLTIWSEYGNSGSRCVSRVIHTKTGAWEDLLNDSTTIGSGTDPSFKQTFPDPNAFYEMGFEWHVTSLRYFMVFGGQEVTLWTYTNPAYIPTLPAAFLFNVWHSTDWWGNGTADYPAADATMRVDWFRYWKE